MKNWRPAPPATYAARTHASPFWAVRYAHERRFHVARELVAHASPCALLDYGCGDGHFLIGLLDATVLPSTTKLYAYEPDREMAETLRANLAASDNRDRVEVITDPGRLPATAFDYVTCMEVLEHLPVTGRFSFYESLGRVLVDGGTALVGVPIEIGPSLLVKEFGRRVLKSDPPDYDIMGLLRVAAGRPVFDATRFDPSATGFIVRHKGFDYRLLRMELERHFTVIDQVSTPLSWLPPWLGNQEIFFTLRRID